MIIPKQLQLHRYDHTMPVDIFTCSDMEIPMQLQFVEVYKKYVRIYIYNIYNEVNKTILIRMYRHHHILWIMF